MKKSIKKYLCKYPFIFKLADKIYQTLYYNPFIRSQLRKQILKTLKTKNASFFVQVGSNDGKEGDLLHNLITANKNWKGIFVEPAKVPFEKLKNNYKNSQKYIFENKAISSNSGVMDFYYVSEKAKSELGAVCPVWYNHLGSFDKEHIIKHLNGLFEPYLLSMKVQSLTLQEILEKNKVIQLDLLHIDTEGYDYKVLSTLDFSKYKPLVITYEHKHLSDDDKKAAESLLKQNGYKCVDYGVDTLAIRI